MGVMAARKPNSFVNLCVTFLSLFGFAAPVFWTGILLIILFVSIWPVFPVGGMMSASLIDAGFIQQWINIAYHLVLPMVTLASIYLALYSRLTRASMQEVLGSDYIRTARAKGLAENKVFYKHALKNSLGPLVTVAGMQFSAVIFRGSRSRSRLQLAGSGNAGSDNQFWRATRQRLWASCFSHLLL